MIKSLLLMLLATAIGLVGLCWAYHLWDADLRTPMYYTVGGDGDFTLATFKSIGDNGWFLVNPYLGAPGVMDLHDFPIFDNLTFLLIKALIELTGSPFVAYNVLFLGGFILALWTSLFVLRRFAVSYPVALAMSLLFAFSSYHFWRGPWQFFLSSYYPIPLVVMVAIWLCQGKPLCFGRPTAARFSLPPEGIIGILVCILISMCGIYYAYFAGFFLCISALIAQLQGRSVRKAADACLLLTVLLASVGAQTIPYLQYWHKHGRNNELLHRNSDDALRFGLYLSYSLQPTMGHRIAALRPDRDFATNDDPVRARLYNIPETRWNSLGLVGGIGFLALMLTLLASGTNGAGGSPLISDLAKLNISAVLLGTTGGLGHIVAYFALPEIRCYNRIFIYMLFLCIFGLSLLIDRLCASMSRTKAIFFFPLLVAFTIVGLLDQVPSVIVPNYPNDRALFESDRDFVERIEAAVPAGSRVFQLPYCPFPEGAPIHRFNGYAHLRLYLHSHRLHWSFGAVRGRDGDRWYRDVASLPPPELISALQRAGFVGITINRSAYPDRGAALEGQLQRQLHGSPVESNEKELIFYIINNTRE